MLLQSENTNTNRDRLWSEEEISQLILYAKDLQQQVDDANAKLIMMNAKLENEEAKVRQFKNLINLMTNGHTRN
jgi:hypothetical protein